MKRRPGLMIGLVAAGVLAVVLASCDKEEEATRVDARHPPAIAHAQSTQNKTGCVSCHTIPIAFTSCIQCHPSPPVELGPMKIRNRHHILPNPLLDCGDCHRTAANDARFVTVPDASHDFCGACHPRTHSAP